MNKMIDTFITEGHQITDETQIERWQLRVKTYLSEALENDECDKFKSFESGWDDFNNLSRQLGYLEALFTKLSALTEGNDAEIITTKRTINLSNKRVFIVHGNDNEAKETVSRFVEKIGLEAVILHEQPNEGLTVVEKFEQHSDVSFAVVLLTPDDKGSSNKEPSKMNNRARQNVVLELGYFLGSLGRNRVCAVYKGDVEIPSDYQGVLYVELDENGAWRNKLAQEFVRAHIDINLSGLL